MSNNLKTLMKETRPQYAAGVPLLLEACALHSDEANGVRIVQLKWRNLENKSIKAVSILVDFWDTFNQHLGTVEHQYINVNAALNAVFGTQEAILMRSNTATRCAIQMKAVVYVDDTMWVPSDDAAFSPLPDSVKSNIPANLQEQHKRDLANQGIKATAAEYIPQQYADLWQCGCGKWHKQSYTVCDACSATEEKLVSTASPELLAEHLSAYLENQEIERKDGILEKARREMEKGDVSNCEEAIRLFESIPGWKNADEKVQECRAKLEFVLAEKEKERLEREKKNALDRAYAEVRAKKRKRKLIVWSVIIALVLIAVCVWYFILVPNQKYNDAVNLMNEGKYENAIAAFEATEGFRDSEKQIKACETIILDRKYAAALSLMDSGKYAAAYDSFIALNGHKDSASKADSIYRKAMSERLSAVKVGEYITFGRYEQDNNTINGKEDIEWEVLDKKNNRILVISRYGLEKMRYNEENKYVYWENSPIRKWLNNDFFYKAFSANEQSIIPTMTVAAHRNPEYSTNPGNSTQDKVFLLSVPEVKIYFPGDIFRQCMYTAYAAEEPAGTNPSKLCSWWLRTPGDYDFYCIAGIDKYGEISGSYNVRNNIAVRPAMWIDLEP